MVVFTHVKPVERRMPARMVETVEKARCVSLITIATAAGCYAAGRTY